MGQIAGDVLRMEAPILKEEFQQGGALQQLFLRYVQTLYLQVSQTAAGNQLHSVDERLARWLLMTHDRLGADEFRHTQEFLSDMLGVWLEGIVKTARVLQREKLIRYVRGHIQILNRAGLEAASCQCYRVLRLRS